MYNLIYVFHPIKKGDFTTLRVYTDAGYIHVLDLPNAGSSGAQVQAGGGIHVSHSNAVYTSTNTAMGVTCDPGEQGIQGIQGDIGPQGIQGTQGDVGPQGIPGADSIVPGPPGASSAIQPLTLVDGYINVT